MIAMAIIVPWQLETGVQVADHCGCLELNCPSKHLILPMKGKKHGGC